MNVVSRIARPAGVVVVPDWRAVRLHEERHLARLLEYLDVDCVFDVGANAGQYGRMLREHVGYRGLIISFEPNPAVLEKLRKASSGDPLWHIESIALGATAGTAQFHALDMSELGSFREFSESHHAPQRAGVRLIDVEVETLADFLPNAWRRWGFKKPFLKMDTQRV
jgi:FkbM family methyltransferase